MYNLIHGDALEELKAIEDESIDALVTDPPAGIGFMGKRWDTFNREKIEKQKGKTASENPPFAYSSLDYSSGAGAEFRAGMREIFKETLRVLKPGAHGLVWALPRTSHWTATALEEAGFEIRDSITHITGQGFPKALDIQTQIEKLDRDGSEWSGWKSALKPAQERWILCRKPYNVNNVEGYFLSNPQELNEVLDSVPWNVGEKITKLLLASQEKMDISRLQEMVSTFLSIVILWNNILEDLLQEENTFTTLMRTKLITELRTLSCLISASIQGLITLEEIHQNGLKLNVSDVIKDLRKIKDKLNYILTTIAQENVLQALSNSDKQEVLSLLLGQEIQTGHGVEDYILVRKPLSEPSIARNVLKHGTGGLNIDGCRIGNETIYINGVGNDNLFLGVTDPLGNWARAKQEGKDIRQGRFPANLLFSHHEDCKKVGSRNEDIQINKLEEWSGFGEKQRPDYESETHSSAVDIYECVPGCPVQELDKQSNCNASRFFYTSKPSKTERNEGCEEVGGNNHPTLKSIKLMRYLCRLITPGGTVIDPFMGSGTTGIAAIQEDFNFVGIEREKEYFEIASARIKNADYEHRGRQNVLFDE